jgi:hypothetical protein
VALDAATRTRDFAIDQPFTADLDPAQRFARGIAIRL